MSRARPIEDVLKDERTSPRIARLLSEIGEIKRFGETSGLKPTSNYREYVQLDRPAVSWIVSACEELRFKPRQWSFPIIGSVPYLGWFKREDAERFSRELRDEGWDVDLRGARAYSTLGWFSDPVLSTMIPEGEDARGELVNVVLHESVHATRYIGGQSTFNESLASFVADRLTPEYLRRKDGEKSPELWAWVASEAESRKRGDRLRDAYARLEGVYASDQPEGWKRAEKARVFDSLKRDLGIPAERRIGNSTLLQFKTYGTGEAEFSKLLESCGGNWDRFWKAISALSADSFQKPQQDDFGEVILRQLSSCR